MYAQTTDKGYFNQIVEEHNRIPQMLQKKKKAVCNQMWYDMGFEFLGGFISVAVHTVALIGKMKAINAYTNMRLKSDSLSGLNRAKMRSRP